MSAKQIQVLTAIITALVTILNSALGLHLNADQLVAIAIAAGALIFAVDDAEVAKQALPQAWTEIGPKLDALLKAMESLTAPKQQ